MSGPENRMVKRVQKGLLEHSVYSEKMNNIYRGGTPDLYIEGDLRIAWCEAKYDDLGRLSPGDPYPFNRALKLLSPLQRSWGQRCIANGVRHLMLVGLSSTTYAVHDNEGNETLDPDVVQYVEVLNKAQTIKRLVYEVQKQKET